MKENLKNLRERAEAIFTFDDYAHNPECNYHHIISKMIDFHNQELQRIGEVKDLEASDNKKGSTCCDAPFNDTNSI